MGSGKIPVLRTVNLLAQPMSVEDDVVSAELTLTVPAAETSLARPLLFHSSGPPAQEGTLLLKD